MPENQGAEIKINKAKAPEKAKPKRKKVNRTKNLMLATDSAIDRLEAITRPGGEIENMDIKELKNLISSIRDLATVSMELKDQNHAGGVVILPEVKLNE